MGRWWGCSLVCESKDAAPSLVMERCRFLEAGSVEALFGYVSMAMILLRSVLAIAGVVGRLMLRPPGWSRALTLVAPSVWLWLLASSTWTLLVLSCHATQVINMYQIR